MPLHRPCQHCGKRFLPNTRYGKLCWDCRKKAQMWMYTGWKSIKRKPKTI